MCHGGPSRPGPAAPGLSTARTSCCPCGRVLAGLEPGQVRSRIPRRVTGARLPVQSRGVDVRVVGCLQRVDSRGELPELVGVPQTDTERPEGRGSGHRSTRICMDSVIPFTIVPSPVPPRDPAGQFR